jgi:hypothetical protein
MKNVLKIQVIYKGHLRGSATATYFKNFFDKMDIDYINKEANTNYDKIEFEHVLYTYPEINFKPAILKYGKTYFPELYKEYTLDDFNEWLDEFKRHIDFKKIVLADVDALKKEQFDQYEDCLRNIKNVELKDRVIDFDYWTSRQLVKYEKMVDLVNDDADLVIHTRPDLLMCYGTEINEHEFRDINNFIISPLKQIQKRIIHLNFFLARTGHLYGGDYYHIGSPTTMKLFFENCLKHNYDLYKEFDRLNKNDHPIVYAFMKNFVNDSNAERKLNLNCALHAMDQNTVYVRHALLYIYVPFDQVFSGRINYHNIHDTFIKP